MSARPVLRSMRTRSPVLRIASPPSAAASGVFLAVRYLIIAAAIYVTIKVLGVTPVAMLLGLLTAFAAVLIEIAQQVSKK